MKHVVVILVLALFCSGSGGTVHAADRIEIMASVLPIWVFVKNVAGERAHVSLLVPPGTDIHEYSLTPRDVKGLYDADILIISGLGLEPFLDRLPKGIKIFEASTGYLSPPADPHIWLDPLMAQRQVDAIAGVLADIDPDGAEIYKDNAWAYGNRLRALHDTLSQQLAPLKGMPIITFHESFAHFATRYGLNAYSLSGPHAEQPLPKRMKEVYDIIRKEGVRSVFAEEQYPPDILKRLESDLGVEVCPLSTVTAGEPSTGLYEQVMKENVRTIIRCIGKVN